MSARTILAVTGRGIQPARPELGPEHELLDNGLEWHLADTPVLTDAEVLALVPSLSPPRTPVGTFGKGAVKLRSVLTCEVGAQGFTFFGGDGSAVLTVSAPELLLLGELGLPSTVGQALDRLVERVGPAAPGIVRANALVAECLALKMVVDAADTAAAPSTEPTSGWTSARRLVDQMDAANAAYRAKRGLTDRPPKPAVIPVSHTAPIFDGGWHIVSPNLALGLVFSFADVYEGGRLHDVYDFELQWMPRRRTIKRLIADHGPSVYLFSNYLWSLAENLEVSALVKELSPESITVHGGPSTPKYDGDTHRFFRQHGHVDVAVRGEGELTTADLLGALDGRLADRSNLPDAGLSVLAEVPGLSYRVGATNDVVRTADRDRFADLDQIPSPYLEGIFDGYANGAARFVILESNRGCPYGCTFCDWGSATLSRIRKFDLDRVYAELEWCARNQVSTLLMADANFGIFARDVEIAQRIVELKEAHGYPLAVTICFAKNTAKYLQPIIQLFIDNGILTEGNLALQSTDEGTLATIERKNIKTETYVQVAGEFRRAGLPLVTDLIIGLPGSTVDSFADDLQFCIDNQVTSRMVRLEVLVNSPMNDPAYRELHQIVPAVEPADISGTTRALVLSTATYTRADLGQMLRLRDIMGVAENVGLFRHAAVWVHHTTGMREVDLYRSIERECRADSERWPLLLWSLRHLVHLAVPPLSWAQLYDEFGRYLVERAGVEPGSELDTVMGVCLALAPSLDRDLPERFELPHDYAAWYKAAFAARSQDPRSWRDAVPALASFGPGTLTVADPHNLCGLIDGSRPLQDGETVDFELRSDVSRSAQIRHIEHTPDELRRRATSAV